MMADIPFAGQDPRPQRTVIARRPPADEASSERRRNDFAAVARARGLLQKFAVLLAGARPVGRPDN